MMKCICDVCGEEIMLETCITTFDSLENTSHFCSNNCASAYFRVEAQKENNEEIN